MVSRSRAASSGHQKVWRPSGPGSISAALERSSTRDEGGSPQVAPWPRSVSSPSSSIPAIKSASGGTSNPIGRGPNAALKCRLMKRGRNRRPSEREVVPGGWPRRHRRRIEPAGERACAITVPTDPLLRVKDAVAVLNGWPHQYTMARFVEEAFTAHLDRLKVEHNGGVSSP